jgi:tetratricopeptide (TPR) repeat protein
MNGKISMKTKVIIFIITAIVAVVSIAYNNKGNFKTNLSTNPIKETVKDKSALVGNTEEKQVVDAKAKELEEKQAVENEKQKALDTEWQTGYDAYNQKKDNSGCIKIMNDIISKDDKYYKAYTLKGIAECYTSSVYYEDGIKNLDKALELKPDYGYGRFNKALALELYAKYPEAITAYKSALEIEDYIWSYYGIASIYGRYGDSKNCVYYLNFAIKQDPELIKSLVKEEHDFDNVRNSKEFIDATK